MSAMKNIESWIERTLTKVIDFFYPPFRKVMSLELFRYAACGGLNLVLEWVLYLCVQVPHHLPDGFLDGAPYQFLGLHTERQDTDCQVFPGDGCQHPH